MILSLSACVQTHEKIEDLKVRIVENRTAVDFVIGDDPSVLVNRYLKQKHNEQSFGIVSSGLMLALPLSPKLALLCYDGQVYTAPNLVRDRIVLSKAKDAEAFNEFQFVKATAGIYFSAWDTRDAVRAAYKKAEPLRIDKPVEITWAKHVGKDDKGNDIFKAVSREETRKGPGKFLIHHKHIYPVPSAWISELKYRSPIKTFFNGSSAGHVRKEGWLVDAD
jgi:hypothetical protein